MQGNVRKCKKHVIKYKSTFWNAKKLQKMFENARMSENVNKYYIIQENAITENMKLKEPNFVMC